MKNKTFCLPLLATVLIFTTALKAQPPTITFQTVLSGLIAHAQITNASDGSNRLFIVELPGTIKVWDGTTVSDFMNLGSSPGGANIVSTGGEEGLLSMAFHPAYDG